MRSNLYIWQMKEILFKGTSMTSKLSQFALVIKPSRDYQILISQGKILKKSILLWGKSIKFGQMKDNQNCLKNWLKVKNFPLSLHWDKNWVQINRQQSLKWLVKSLYQQKQRWMWPTKISPGKIQMNVVRLWGRSIKCSMVSVKWLHMFGNVRR